MTDTPEDWVVEGRHLVAELDELLEARLSGVPEDKQAEVTVHLASLRTLRDLLAEEVGLGRETFTALDWFHIKGRGRVCTVEWGKTAGEARALVGQEVEIDGAVHLVRGVETHAVSDSATERLIGLLAGECVVVTTPGSHPGDLTLAYECGVEFLLQNLPPTWRYDRDWPGKVHPHTPPGWAHREVENG